MSLGNVLNASNPKEELTFVAAKDKELFNKFRGKAFEVQVGLHELLGHGTGKLLAKDSKGKLNFDQDKVINLVTGKPVETYYLPEETYYTKFSDIASSYEECRAESVGIFLCVQAEILKIFGFEGEDAKHITYINWLLMCRAGVLALEFFNPDSKKWLQAHMQARYAILRVLLEAGNGLVQLIKDSNGDTVVELDDSKIYTIGVEAIGNFLLKLSKYHSPIDYVLKQIFCADVFKAVADAESARGLYNQVTEVSDTFLHLRKEVMEKKKPRRVFVQSRTVLEEQSVKLVEYAPSSFGLIQHFLDRFAQ